MVYKWCVVPQCTNTSIKSPHKLFVSVPTKPKRRKKWLQLAGRDPNSIVPHSNVFMCEDHLDMEKDTMNYMQYKMGFSQKILLKDEAVPLKFHCQEVCKRRDTGSTRKGSTKGRRKDLVKRREEETQRNDDVDEQQCLQATQPPVVTDVAAENLNQVNVVHIKKDPEYIDIEVGPFVLQHMDSHFSTDQINIKQEYETDNEDDERGLCNVENDEVLISQVKVEFTMDEVNEFTEDEEEASQHDEYRCEECPETYTRNERLKRHCEQKHKTNFYTCTECDKEFNCKSYLSKQALYYHVLRNHCQNSEEPKMGGENVHSVEGKEGQSFTCDYCQKIYSEKILLQQHIKSVHQCLKCDKYFKTRYEKFVHYKVEECFSAVNQHLFRSSGVRWS